MPFSTNAITLLQSRYLQPGETIDGLLDRVSMGKSKYRQIIESLQFLPNSPTLFNLGTEHKGTLSACFKFDVPDSMEGIMDVARKSALVQKFGGGVGYALSALRPLGSPIRTTHGKACGPVAVLSLYQSVAEMVTQGGKRRGAQMGILDITHPDIRSFIHLKDNDPQQFNTFNISVAIPDSFMEAVIDGEEESVSLFREVVNSSWTTGDPGVYFYDQAERSNPTKHLGRLTGTNPCGEVPLLDNEACNLGSINLAAFVTKGRDGWQFDWPTLGGTVRTAVQYLDEVIDHNTFPAQEIQDAVAKTRKLGLGVMGWADALALMGVPYDSDEALALGYEVMMHINEVAAMESKSLGIKKGAYPAAKGEYFRNATRTCIAPTGTIAILAGCSSGIEPHYALSWKRTLGDGTVLDESIPVLDRLNGFRPKTSHEIDWSWHIKHQAIFQQHTDLAVSKTINLPNDATKKDVWDAFIMMWEKGCKGGTIFRDGCRDEQVLHVDHVAGSTTDIRVPEPLFSGGEEIGGVEYFAHEGGSTPPPPPHEHELIQEEGCVRCEDLSCAYSACSV